MRGLEVDRPIVDYVSISSDVIVACNGDTGVYCECDSWIDYDSGIM